MRPAKRVVGRMFIAAHSLP